ncbi:MAG: DUF1937 family protein [Deltaproteobacteria bacterium]|nr:DUF1937 family protein [Deltaproteobacteria bacterium]
MSARKLWYLAAPYTHKSRRERAWRARQIDQAAYQIMAQGLLVHSPISGGHAIEWGCAPLPHGRWMDLDRAVLWALHETRRLAGVILYRLPGWEGSAGVREELVLTGEEWGYVPLALDYGEDVAEWVARMRAERRI